MKIIEVIERKLIIILFCFVFTLHWKRMATTDFRGEKSPPGEESKNS